MTCVEACTAASQAAPTFAVSPGVPLPLGAHECCDGINIAVFSRHATAVTLVLFEDDATPIPLHRIVLEPRRHRSGDIWHVRLHGAARGWCYGFDVDGPFAPDAGHRFQRGRLLLDPYAGVVSLSSGLCAVLVDESFDWEDTAPPRHRWSDTVIYETHVRGLTIHPSAGARNSGRYLGVVEKIPYLKALGVTAIELMPVQAFDPGGSGRRNPLTGEVLGNYWGYDPIALFAPAPHYAEGGAEAAARAFKTMVRELHRAGIEVILDVVFNHTGEGDESGPTSSFRGLDNAIYYLLQPDKRHYADFSDCGNSLNCNHPVVRRMIIDCLRHWVTHYRIDGFQFDLASVLGRDPEGRLLENPPLLAEIAEDPLLRETRLVAEAWDSAGAFQVGHFPGQRWAEWNCCFRDHVRRFWRGDPGMTGRFASRLCGSADLYGRAGNGPLKSVNFITSHDGFTLNDLVSYARKHNEANGEENRDGFDTNWSENNGIEGTSEEPAIETMRHRQIRNMLATLFLSRGVPMLLGGDEFRRTQQGNNNTFCQDNAISWYDRDLAETNASLIRFVQRLVAFRRAHPVLASESFYTEAEITWMGVDGRPPEWDGAENRIGCIIKGEPPLCLLFNASRRACAFSLASTPVDTWRVAFDTTQDDAPDPSEQPSILADEPLELAPRSLLVLAAAAIPGSRRRPATL